MDSREDGRRGDGRITDKAIEEGLKRSCLPHGRRAWAKKPNGLPLAGIAAGILLQSASGGHGWQMRRLAGGGRWEDPCG